MEDGGVAELRHGMISPERGAAATAHTRAHTHPHTRTHTHTNTGASTWTRVREHDGGEAAAALTPDDEEAQFDDADAARDAPAATSWFAALSSALARVWVCGGAKIRVNSRELRVVRQVAEGGYSYVYLCEDVRTREVYGVKEVLCQTGEARAAVRQEVQVLRALKGQMHVCPLLDVAFERVGGGNGMEVGREKARLLFPYYPRGSMQDLLTARMPHGPYLDERSALRCLLGVAKALRAMHHHVSDTAHTPAPWAHRDVCPRNILLDASGEPVLIDFGSTADARVAIRSRFDAARLAETAAANSTISYRAPELFDPPTGSLVTEKTDVWSLGATAYAMVFGHSPFESEKCEDGSLRPCAPSHTHTLAPVTFPTRPSASAAYCELVLWMLNKDMSARPSIDDAIARLCTQLGVPVDIHQPRPTPAAGSDDFQPFVDVKVR